MAAFTDIGEKKNLFEIHKEKKNPNDLIINVHTHRSKSKQPAHLSIHSSNKK